MSKIYAGADWIKPFRKGVPISEFGKTVADLLGDAYLGIYHLNRSALLAADWTDDMYIEINVGEMATYDNDILTRLVLLAHDRCVRMEIRPNMKYLKLVFHPHKRGGNIFEGMPTLEEHVAGLRKHYKGSHE